MQGSEISRRPWLAWLAAPGLGMLKYLRTTTAFFGFARAESFRHPGLLVVLLLGSIWWVRGFAAGARTGLSGIRGVIDPEENIFILMKQCSRDQDDREPGN